MKKLPKVSLKRQVKKTKKNVEQAQEVTTESVNKHLVRRWGKLKDVRRFVIGWLVLVVVLCLGVLIQSTALERYYMEESPVVGGKYIEGIVGKFSNLNPIFSVSSTDLAVTKLSFSSLLQYDDENNLVGDLATSWSVDSGNVIYTINMRDDVYWHDGEKLTADDVVFTYKAIQSPDTSSPLADSWKGIEIQAIDDYTVTFSLPNKYTPFPHSLTNGIIPQHILGETPYTELRAHDFNLSPVGSGVYEFDRLFVGEQRSQVFLSRNADYYATPAYIEEIEIQGYEDYPLMISAFRSGELSAITALRSYDIAELADMQGIKEYNFQLFSQVFVFLNNNDELLKDSSIRKALVYATDKNAIFKATDARYPIGDSPLLSDQLGYDPEIVQPDFNPDKANEILDEAGWKRGKDGVRIKDGKRLEIELVSQNSDEYPSVLAEIQKDWLQAGVIANLSLISDQEFTQNFIAPHEYQALVFGVTQGVDPDVFPYWHSSQAVKNGFNISNYKSTEADTALEAGRTRTGDQLRSEKYKAFLEEWMKDNPAIALYRPVFNYVIRDSVSGIEAHPIPSPVERFNNVNEWFIETQLVQKSL